MNSTAYWWPEVTCFTSALGKMFAHRPELVKNVNFLFMEIKVNCVHYLEGSFFLPRRRMLL